ncbi:hypothetical protein OSB04_001861 [Centaurea solstitialis]|uniref:Uncharacterized protein n=1 Tax=Centaurea solstitialis TaxID=347529 RepID=A0AA38WSW7_9ASTR|nr:hypothetical protein OSB04_001861 [Centaurea solstitialis]
MITKGVNLDAKATQGWIPLEKLPHLETLELCYSSYNAEDVEVIGRTFPQLKSFKMKMLDILVTTELIRSESVSRLSEIRFSIFVTVNSSQKTRFMEWVGDAYAIANSMPALRHLHLFGSLMMDDGLYAILHCCPHIESLDIRRCFDLNLCGNLEKSCRKIVQPGRRS